MIPGQRPWAIWSNKNYHRWKIPPTCLWILFDLDSIQYFKQNDQVLWRCLFIWACEGLSIRKALHINVWEMAWVTAMAAGGEEIRSAHARDVSLGARIVDVMYMTAVLPWHVEKKLLPSDGQQENYSKAKFPSNLKCGQKIVCETPNLELAAEPSRAYRVGLRHVKDFFSSLKHCLLRLRKKWALWLPICCTRDGVRQTWNA